MKDNESNAGLGASKTVPGKPHAQSLEYVRRMAERSERYDIELALREAGAPTHDDHGDLTIAGRIRLMASLLKGARNAEFARAERLAAELTEERRLHSQHEGMEHK